MDRAIWPPASSIALRRTWRRISRPRPKPKIKVDAGLNGGSVKVSAAVDGVESESKDLKVQILLVEKEIRHLGENGVRFHPMVVRAIAGEKAEGYHTGAQGQRRPLTPASTWKP